jgi:osmoprotectant transport system permease protein
LNLSKLSELLQHPNLRAGLSHEFIERADCYPLLQKKYGLTFGSLSGLAHSLSYDAIEKGEVDIIDIYSTDSKIVKYRLKVLEDDRRAFPEYQGVFLARPDLPERFPRTWQALQKLRSQLNEATMIQLNGAVELEKRSFAEVAANFLGNASVTTANKMAPSKREWLSLTYQHLQLVLVSLFASILVGVPLGIWGSRSEALGQGILFVVGVVQTVPSLALLCFLIPWFGIGNFPALFALFLYGLLPVVRGSYLGFQNIDPKIREVARALSLNAPHRLFQVYFPFAMPSLLSGVKTSAIINVGNATLAALIGAGGYGVPIVAGLALNDMSMVLRGAVPAALMALGVHAFFELLERGLVSKGLRFKART